MCLGVQFKFSGLELLLPNQPSNLKESTHSLKAAWTAMLLLALHSLGFDAKMSGDISHRQVKWAAWDCLCCWWPHWKNCNLNTNPFRLQATLTKALALMLVSFAEYINHWHFAGTQASGSIKPFNSSVNSESKNEEVGALTISYVHTEM